MLKMTKNYSKGRRSNRRVDFSRKCSLIQWLLAWRWSGIRSRKKESEVPYRSMQKVRPRTQTLARCSGWWSRRQMRRSLSVLRLTKLVINLFFWIFFEQVMKGDKCNDYINIYSQNFIFINCIILLQRHLVLCRSWEYQRTMKDELYNV